MLHSVRSFMFLCLIVGTIGLFFVTMVHVLSEPRPSFTKVPSITGIIVQTAT